MHITVDGMPIAVGALGTDVIDYYLPGCVEVFQESWKTFVDEKSIQRYPIVVAAVRGKRVFGSLLTSEWRPVDTLVWQRVVPELSSDPPGFSIEQAAVLPDWRGRGIGKAMIRYALGDVYMPCINRLYGRWMAVSRVPQQGKSSFNLLRRLDFVELGRAFDFYADEPPGGCPSCGDGACSCEAALMEWRREKK